MAAAKFYWLHEMRLPDLVWANIDFSVGFHYGVELALFMDALPDLLAGLYRLASELRFQQHNHLLINGGATVVAFIECADQQLASLSSFGPFDYRECRSTRVGSRWLIRLESFWTQSLSMALNSVCYDFHNVGWRKCDLPRVFSSSNRLLKSEIKPFKKL